jgi:hypothetical protein
MDPKERRSRIDRLIADLAKSGATEVQQMLELTNLQFEEAKERLVDAEGADVARIQGEARAFEKFTRQFNAAVALLRQQK